MLHRCAECGEERPSLGFSGGPPSRCERHPESPVLSWTWGLQAAANYLTQRINTGATWEQLEKELLVDLDRGRRARNIATVWPYVQRWGGLPESRLPVPSTTGNPLFGA